MASEDDRLLEAVREVFPPPEVESVLERLSVYGKKAHEREPARVRLAIVALAKRDPSRLDDLISVAKQDYRDILAWASEPAPTPEQGARDLADARRILEKWGKK